MKEVSYRLIIKAGLWVLECLLYSCFYTNFSYKKLKNTSKKLQAPGFSKRHCGDVICTPTHFGEQEKSLVVGL